MRQPAALSSPLLSLPEDRGTGHHRCPIFPSVHARILGTLASTQLTSPAVISRQFLRPFGTGIDFNPHFDLYLVWKGILYLADNFSNPDLLPGTLYMMILRTLNQGPMHGYAIAKRIQNWSKGELEIEDGSLYPALNRMLTKGWLKAEWGQTQNNRKARFYQLTPTGKKQLEAESSAFNKMIRAIQLVMRTS